MFSFSKNYRLLKKQDFDFVFSQAKRLGMNGFLILYRENGREHPRIGFALSKKKIAKAHDRNRIKRLVRESFRTHRLPAIDMIFLAQQGIKKETNASITAGLINAWEKLNQLA